MFFPEKKFAFFRYFRSHSLYFTILAIDSCLNYWPLSWHKNPSETPLYPVLTVSPFFTMVKSYANRKIQTCCLKSHSSALPKDWVLQKKHFSQGTVTAPVGKGTLCSIKMEHWCVSLRRIYALLSIQHPDQLQNNTITSLSFLRKEKLKCKCSVMRVKITALNIGPWFSTHPNRSFIK